MDDDIVQYTEDTQLWDRLDSETDKDYRLFDMYLRLGPDRRIVDMTRAYEGHVPDKTVLNKLSSKHNWKLRATAYDNSMVVSRQAKYRTEVEDLIEQEFGELKEAYQTSHALRERIHQDKNSSTYSLLNAWNNWVNAHSKITDELFKIAGKPQEAQPLPDLQEFTLEETKKTTDREKIEEVTKALRMIKQ